MIQVDYSKDDSIKQALAGVHVVISTINWQSQVIDIQVKIAAAAKEVGSNGEASLAVLDDKHEGAAASVVVIDASGLVLDSKPTTVGEDA